jgi:hypothetical protein
VGWTPELDGVAERARDVLLTDDVFEALRAPAKIERAVRLCRRSAFVCWRWGEILEHVGEKV